MDSNFVTVSFFLDSANGIKSKLNEHEQITETLWGYHQSNAYFVLLLDNLSQLGAVIIFCPFFINQRVRGLINGV